MKTTIIRNFVPALLTLGILAFGPAAHAQSPIATYNITVTSGYANGSLYGLSGTLKLYPRMVPMRARPKSVWGRMAATSSKHRVHSSTTRTWRS